MGKNKTKIIWSIYIVFMIIILITVGMGIYKKDLKYFDFFFLAFNIIFYTYIYDSLINITEAKNKKKIFFIEQFEKLDSLFQKEVLIKWDNDDSRKKFLSLKRKIEVYFAIIKKMNDDYGDQYKIAGDIELMEEKFKNYLVIAEEAVEVKEFNSKETPLSREIDLITSKVPEILRKIHFF